MARNNNTFGCIAVIIFFGLLYISATTDIPVFGYLMAFAFGAIFLIVLFDILSSHNSRTTKDVKKTANQILSNDTSTSTRTLPVLLKSENQIPKKSSFSVTKITI